MSRIGRAPIVVPDKVEVKIGADNVVSIKSGNKEMVIPMQPSISAKLEDGQVHLKRENDEPKNRSFHGLYRSLIQNAVTGVSKGWSKSLILNGVGYRAAVSGKNLELNIGYSHPVVFPIPDGLEVKVEKQTTVNITGADKELVGQVAAKIRGFRPPEPFLGKGIRYSDEYIRRKAGKSAGK
ncbi:MAG: 50S ribosomal protein L6 [Bdellovibrionales bacterium]|nr:50S ribosomal protein L6 [Bdellovibrionales bacterium]